MPAGAGDSLGLHGTLSSEETAISVEAGAHAPRLTTLALRGGAGWSNRAEEALPGQVEIQGEVRALTWRLDRAAGRVDPMLIEFVYVADTPRLKLTWRWRARGAAGPLEHSVSIENLSGQTVWLPLQPSFRFDWRIDPVAPLERFWVEKGADTPSAEGIHRDPLRGGDAWTGTSSTYARPMQNQPREMIPYLLVEEPGEARRGWYLGIEFSGRTRITLQRAGASVSGEAGLNPLPAGYRTRLAAGGTFETPPVFLGTFAGGPDGAGNIVRRWVRGVLQNPATLRDDTYPMTTNNSWGSGTAVDEALAHRMIEDSADLGLEMFHLDAGWFRDVGDWHADPAKFPQGIASIADFAHVHGLKFGLWVDWTQAGTSPAPGALNVFDPAIRGWLIADPPAGWKHSEPFKGITMDLGVPEVKAWAASELERIVGDYRLDMLEHDGYLVAQGSFREDAAAAPAAMRTYEDSGYLWVDAPNATDSSYRATRAYYDIYGELRARHPKLLLEICNDGGRMMDFGSAAHGDYFSVTDTYDPLANRRAFYDASFVLPPAMLESYVENWPAPTLENLRYMLRSGMLGWFSLMLDTSRWSAAQRSEARAQVALYKTALRPLIRDADVYHIADRPDGIHWDGMEYYSAARRRGVLYAFRGAAPDQPTHRFRLAGLESGGTYRLKFQDRGAVITSDGESLMRQGVEVGLPMPLSSELIFVEEIH